jgi:hypothetical protein
MMPFLSKRFDKNGLNKSLLKWEHVCRKGGWGTVAEIVKRWLKKKLRKKIHLQHVGM